MKEGRNNMYSYTEDDFFYETYEKVETAVESVFEQMQESLGITDGGIEPLDSVDLDDAQEKLTEIICRVLKWELAHEGKVIK